MTLPSELQQIVDQHAKEYAVSNVVHEKDFIFQFLMNHPGFQSKDHAVRYYFSDGENSARKFVSLISAFTTKKCEVLEFASGYGCVSRHFKNRHDHSFVACDIHPEAIALIADKIGMEALLSSQLPETFNAPRAFDVVFALSFFSHMPHATWGRWIKSLIRALKGDGLFVFTTHGRQSVKYFGEVQFDERGYWFRADSEQKDLSPWDYGQTIVLPRYVFSELEKITNASLVFFQEAYWWGHQDVYVVRKHDGV